MTRLEPKSRLRELRGPALRVARPRENATRLPDLLEPRPKGGVGSAIRPNEDY